MRLPPLKVNSKKQALQELAAKAAELCGQNERVIFDILLQREKLGSTAVGNGVAIPHGKLPKLNKLFGLFARLERPIDFEALDGQPVDLVLLLLAPEGAGADHLKALARVARLLRDPEVARKLRQSRDAQALYAVLAMPPAARRERGSFQLRRPHRGDRALYPSRLARESMHAAFTRLAAHTIDATRREPRCIRSSKPVARSVDARQEYQERIALGPMLVSTGSLGLTGRQDIECLKRCRPDERPSEYGNCLSARSPPRARGSRHWRPRPRGCRSA